MNQTKHIAAPTTATPQVADNPAGQTWRLTRWYLFAMRRRLMSKILLGLLAGFFVIVVAFNILNYVSLSSAASAPPSACQPTVVGTSAPGDQQNSGQSCQDIQQQDITSTKAIADQQRQSLTFPMSLNIGGSYLGSMGIILACILVASVVGGEYSAGTLRLTLSRGTQRGQVITAQIAALAILALAEAALILALAAIAGVIIGPLIGGTIPAFSVGAVVELPLYWLANALAIFTFGLIALLMSTLSRNIIAGIAVAISYLLFESIIGNVLYFAGASLKSSFGDFMSHIPDYLVGYNTGALTHLAAQSPIALYPPQFSPSGATGPGALLGPGASIDTAHALILVAIYCLLFGGLSYLFLRRRDVTE